MFGIALYSTLIDDEVCDLPSHGWWSTALLSVSGGCCGQLAKTIYAATKHWPVVKSWAWFLQLVLKSSMTTSFYLITTSWEVNTYPIVVIISVLLLVATARFISSSKEFQAGYELVGCA